MEGPIRWKALLPALLLPLGLGGLSAWLVGESFSVYETLYKPLLAPPGWLFPVVWSALYLLMGYASYRIWMTEASPGRKRRALLVYLGQLLLNVSWPLWFFKLSLYGFSAFWAGLLLAAAGLCALLFAHLEEKAGRLLLPYLLWLAYALYLSVGVWLLN